MGIDPLYSGDRHHESLDRRERYWLALGRFIHEFASVETSVQTLLWIVTDTSPQVAKAIFSGTRSDTACSYIRRTLQAQGQRELPPLLERAFSHLKTITTVRNDIVHYGAQFNDSTTFVTNAMLALPGGERTTQVPAKTLEDLWSDLRTIQACMTAYVFTEKRPHLGHKTAQQWLSAAQAPWRYKPDTPQEARRRAPTAARPPKRQHQQRPSQE